MKKRPLRKGRTQLPPLATPLQRALYPFLRNFFYFFFAYLPYAPVRRINKPDLSGPLLWASSHSNYLCDTIPAAYEGPSPTKFLAKNTLFRFPIGGFISFCGALPVMRAEDHAHTSREGRSVQNRSTFARAIAALKQGWAVAVFPEGMSVVSPGIVLPLKPGIAKLGFAAEEDCDFQLGLRLIPVGLEYGSRVRVGSGLTIRYGRPILLADYREKYLESREQGVQAVMDDLSRELVHCFPHFRDETTAVLGRKLVSLGLCRYKYDAAQLFLWKAGDGAFWAGLEQHMRAFEEATKGRGIPVSAWGHRQAWKELGPARRRKRLLLLALGAPLAVLDFLNNTLPEIFLRSLVDFLAVDATEKMSLRFICSPVVLGTLFGLQFWFLKKVVFVPLMGEAGWGAYVLYTASSFVLWHLAVHWQRQFKRLASSLFFLRAGVGGRSDAVAHYRALRQYLGQFQDHGREGR